jgi:hypothetical protein
VVANGVSRGVDAELSKLLRPSNGFHHQLGNGSAVLLEMWRPTAMIDFDTLIKEVRKVAAPGRVTTVSYSGLRFALECGIDVWDYCETLTLAAVIANHGTPKHKQRLQEEIKASRWCSELYMEDQRDWREAT